MQFTRMTLLCGKKKKKDADMFPKQKKEKEMTHLKQWHKNILNWLSI